jgi:hypothetical protein
MASRSSRPHRLLLPTLLAAVLAGELAGIVVGHSLTWPATPAASIPASASALGADRDADRGIAAARPWTAPSDASRDVLAAAANAARQRTGVLPGRPATAPVSPVRATTVAKPATTSTNPAGPTKTSASDAYRGRNHVWIPSLGTDKSIESFPCSRSRPPDTGVYRWGCAGRNNIYLLSHAWSTFKPLHDAYVRGRLKKGMKVHYADGGGAVETYSVIWWKVTAPTTAAKWAWASLDRSSMTLQTCVGARSEDRLMVRLVKVG